MTLLNLKSGRAASVVVTQTMKVVMRLTNSESCFISPFVSYIQTTSKMANHNPTWRTTPTNLVVVHLNHNATNESGSLISSSCGQASP